MSTESHVSTPHSSQSPSVPIPHAVKSLHESEHWSDPPRQVEMSTVKESPSIPLSSGPEDSPLNHPAEPLSGERLKEISDTLGDLPALPDVALRAMRLAESPEWDLRELDVTIRRDQALAARFLRLANSTFFGARSKISTLDRAINMVGITRVRSVLLAAALEGLHEGKRSNFKGKILWDHALAAGCISQHLALAHSRSDSEEAFMAGLLHDIGRPILDQMLGDQYAEVITLVKNGVAASLLSAEQRVFGFDHTDIGFVAVTAWAFPPRSPRRSGFITTRPWPKPTAHSARPSVSPTACVRKPNWGPTCSPTSIWARFQAPRSWVWYQESMSCGSRCRVSSSRRDTSVLVSGLRGWCPTEALPRNRQESPPRATPC